MHYQYCMYLVMPLRHFNDDFSIRHANISTIVRPLSYTKKNPETYYFKLFCIFLKIIMEYGWNKVLLSIVTVFFSKYSFRYCKQLLFHIILAVFEPSLCHSYSFTFFTKYDSIHTLYTPFTLRMYTLRTVLRYII